MFSECLAHQKWGKVYGHTTLNTPNLVRSGGRGSCLDLELEAAAEGKVDGIPNTSVSILVK